MAKIVLTKTDAAIRQLNTAIYMWFHEVDSVSTHVLACSAHELIQGINRHLGGPELLFDSTIFKDEYRAKIISIFKKGYNFFKHADRDPNAQLEFDEVNTESFLFISCYGLEAMGIKPDSIRGAMNIYYMIRHPEFINEKGKIKWMESMPHESLKIIINGSKADFFDWYVYMRQTAEGINDI